MRVGWGIVLVYYFFDALVIFFGGGDGFFLIYRVGVVVLGFSFYFWGSLFMVIGFGSKVNSRI